MKKTIVRAHRACNKAPTRYQCWPTKGPVIVSKKVFSFVTQHAKHRIVTLYNYSKTLNDTN